MSSNDKKANVYSELISVLKKLGADWTTISKIVDLAKIAFSN